jgi:DNA-binding response OmpR family regulator
MPAAPLTVLVAEDDPQLRRLLAEVLRRGGFVPLLAADGQEALDLFLAQRPPIVVSDVFMPRLDGLELLLRIKREAPAACIVITTGFGSEEIAIQAIRHGASNYFKKPIDLSEFSYSMGVLAQVVTHRQREGLDYGLLREERRTLVFGNNLEERYAVIRLLTETAGAFRFDVEAIRTGLLEIITNAIEHGNLGISRDEKREALREGRFAALLGERAESPERRDLRVTVESVITPDAASFTVSDQGEGFDWRDFPCAMEPAALLDECGRGLLITRLCMDRVDFSAPGNRVTISKGRAQSAGGG